MANLISLARPYASAAFETARDKQQLPAWKLFLETAAFTVKQPAVTKLLTNPEVSSTTLLTLFRDILDSFMDKERDNFLALLTQNKRLILLPDIATLFTTYCAAYEKINTVQVVSAIDMKDEQKQQFVQALTKRSDTQVKIQYSVDPRLIAGAVIYINGKVIDGSVRGKLTRLLEYSLR
jgi:F-type H+-transporting ATPase subunit delta